MVFSYSQLSQYLACPRRYRYRYLEGWREKDIRANVIFGRVFEDALAAYFRCEDASLVFFEGWSQYRNQALEFGTGDSWDKMLHGGFLLLDRFAQQDRVRIRRPRNDLQIRFSKPMGKDSDFVAYVDAIGEVDGQRCVIDWKTTTSRFPDGMKALVSLDPQLICYSWLTGEPTVSFVVFVRRRLPDIQILTAVISDQQRREFADLVKDTVSRIEAGSFLPQTGIRFPNNGCTTCSHVGLCLADKSLIDRKLTRREGMDLDWLDELAA